MARHQPTDQQASEIHQRVDAQFGPAAAAYSSSLTHSDSGALSRVVEVADPRPEYVVLDIATGAGHTALALAPHVTQVIAYDTTEQMLAETRHHFAAWVQRMNAPPTTVEACFERRLLGPPPSFVFRSLMVPSSSALPSSRSPLLRIGSLSLLIKSR